MAGNADAKKPEDDDAASVRNSILTLEIDYPERLSRRLLLIKWLFVLPAITLVIASGMLLILTTFISFWAILISGRYPQTLFRYAQWQIGYTARTAGYFPLLMTDQYPSLHEPPDPAFRYRINEARRSSRWMLLRKMISFHLFAAGTLVTLAVITLILIAIPIWFVILATGRYPRWIFDLVTAIAQWISNIATWQWLLRDEWSLVSTTRPLDLMITGAGITIFVFWVAILPILDIQFSTHQIAGVGMLPTLEDDYILIGKGDTLFGTPGRGDIVVFKTPGEERQGIGRIVGLPGEVIHIVDGTTYVDGIALQESYVEEGYGESSAPVRVPEDCYYLLGDNRGDTMDSRVWGAVPRENIIGKVLFRYWPLSDIGPIGSGSPTFASSAEQDRSSTVEGLDVPVATCIP